MDKVALVSPLLSITVVTSVILGFFVSRKTRDSGIVGRLAAVGLLASALCLMLLLPEPEAVPRTTLYGLYMVDGLGVVAGIMVTLAGAVTLFMSRDYMRRLRWNHPEIPVLVLMAVAGMLVMVLTDHVGVIFLGLEVMSLSLYVLSGSVRTRPASIEAGLKYFLTGAFASGILLMGIVLLYGSTGEMALPAIGAAIDRGDLLALTGMLLVTVGFGFKVSAAPFHQWAPDVYEGAPTPVTGFMSTAVKVAAFTALVRVVSGVGPLDGTLVTVLGSLAVLTMLVGNVGALAQRSVKRMLAYSSVSHAGYLLVGVTALAAGVPAVDAILVYLAAYALMNLGAFGILSLLENREGDGLSFDDLAGLKERQPVLAAGMLLFMLSLAGIPPTGGFLAKWKLFDVVAQGIATGHADLFVLLLVTTVLSSVIGLAYYLRVVVAMYMVPSPELPPLHPRPARATLALSLACAFLTLWLGFGPGILGLGAEELLSLVRTATTG